MSKTIDNPYFWAELSGICKYIEKNRNEDGTVWVSDDTMALISTLAAITAKEMIGLSNGVRV